MQQFEPALQQLEPAPPSVSSKSPTQRKAAEVPAFADHDQTINAPHRRDEGVKSTGLRASSISVLTSQPMDFRDARVRSDCNTARVCSDLSALAWVCSSLGFVREFRRTSGSFGSRRARVRMESHAGRVHSWYAAGSWVRLGAAALGFVGAAHGSGSFGLHMARVRSASPATTPAPRPDRNPAQWMKRANAWEEYP
jgi:hypothetical protein